MPVKETLRRWWISLPPLLCILALVHPMASLLARWDWRLDLISHFRRPAFLLTLMAVASQLPRRRRAALVLSLLAIVQAEPLIRYILPTPVRPAGRSAPRLRLLVANVLVDNHDYSALSELIRTTRPDVVGLIEVSDEWMAGLSDIAREYPFRLDAPDGPRGLALWFKTRPISIDPPRSATAEGWPYLHAVFSFAGKPRHLWLAHPSSPMRRKGRFRGFPELDGLAARIASNEGSTIVLGDMNTTDGSPHFRDFLATTGLRDSRLGFGEQPSWPVGWPLKIAIDHAFLPDDLAAVSRVLGPPIGSDHRPFWIDLAPAESSARSKSADQDSASTR